MYKDQKRTSEGARLTEVKVPDFLDSSNDRAFSINGSICKSSPFVVFVVFCGETSDLGFEADESEKVANRRRL